MKSYYKILLPLLTFTWIMFSMTSCSEEEFDITEEETTTSEPDTLAEVVVRGQITDLNGELLTNAKVEILHGEDILTTVTDDQGNYIFDDLPASGQKVSLRTSADGFVTRLGITHLNKPEQKKDYTLAKIDDIDQDGPPSNLVLTNNLYEISGKILLDDGTPAENIRIVMLDVTFENWVYSVTDENGDWSIVTEPRNNVFIAASYECGGSVTLEEDISIIDQDIDLGTFNSEFSPFEQYIFTGFVTDCNTEEGLLIGNVTISFEGDFKSFSGSIANGEYFIIADNCNASDCYDITISSGEEAIEELCQEISSPNISKDYTLCGPIIVDNNEGDFTLTIGQNTFNFPLVSFVEDTSPDRWLVTGMNVETNKLLVLQTITNGVSTEFSPSFAIGNFALIADYIGIDDTAVSYTIDSVTTEFVYGSVSGTVVNANFTQFPLSGNFKAVIEQ